MATPYRPGSSVQGDLDELFKRRRQQAATGLVVPGPGGTWVTVQQDAQARADAARTSSVAYTNDTINAQNLPALRATVTNHGALIADAGSRLGGVEGSVGTLFGHTGALRVDVDYVAGRATTGINNAASAQSAAGSAQSTANSAASAASNAATRAQQAYDYADSLADALSALQSMVSATRSYIKSQHPTAPWAG